MGTDLEGILGADDVAEAWDLAVADVLYEDHPRAAPAQPAGPGDEEPFIPIDESDAGSMSTDACAPTSSATPSTSPSDVV
jgi:hypothetical protein